ncbi:MAG: hypothetical protein HY579_09380 [Nitrospinae bacterium]|nr:hypothetical protein [Nitrospinota bacterium]
MTYPVLGDVFNSAGDNAWHVANEWILSDRMREEGPSFVLSPRDFGTPLFGMYQTLFYLVVAGLHHLSLGTVPVLSLHNFTLAAFFSLYPFSVYFCLRKFGFPALCCGLGSLLALAPISGWGNTLHAYFTLGIVTQAPACFLFPIAVGEFHDALANRKSPVTAAVLIALVFIAHLIIFVQLILVLALAVFLEFLRARPRPPSQSPSAFFRSCLTAGILFLALIAFRLAPFLFFSEYQLIPESARHSTPQYISFSPVTLVDSLFNGELLDNSGKAGRLWDPSGQGFRWPNNENLDRHGVLTLLTLAGFFIALSSLRHFKNAFLALGFPASLLFLLGYDIKPFHYIVPFYSDFSFLRGIFAVEFFSVCLAALGLFHISIGIGSWIAKKMAIDSPWLRAASFLAIAGLVLYPLYRERYYMAQEVVDAVDSDIMKNIREIAQTLPDAETQGRVYFNKGTTGQVGTHQAVIQPPAVSLQFNVMGTNGIFSDYREQIPRNPALSRLLGINYFIYDNDWFEKHPDSGWAADHLDLLKKGEMFSSYRLKSASGLFEFLPPRAVLVFADDSNWYHLNRQWFLDYSQGRNEAVFLMRAPGRTLSESADLRAGRFPVLLLLDYQTGNEEKAKSALRSYLEDGGTIVSQRPLWGLKVRLVRELKEDLSSLMREAVPEEPALVSLEQGGPLISWIQGRSPQFTARAVSPQDRFLLFKMNYFAHWKAEIDGKPAPTYWSAPGFIAVFLERGEHVLKFRYSVNQWLKWSQWISLAAWILVFFRWLVRSGRGGAVADRSV